MSVDGLKKAVNKDLGARHELTGHCTACLTGEYPGGVPDELSWWMCIFLKGGGLVVLTTLLKIPFSLYYRFKDKISKFCMTWHLL